MYSHCCSIIKQYIFGISNLGQSFSCELQTSFKKERELKPCFFLPYQPDVGNNMIHITPSVALINGIVGMYSETPEQQHCAGQVI